MSLTNLARLHHTRITFLAILIIFVPAALTIRQTKLGSANTRFAADLYRNIGWWTNNRYRNIAFSPLAVSNTLAVAYAGAEGRSRDQLRRAMYLEEFTDDMELHEAYRSLHLTLARLDSNFTYHLASRVYVGKDVTLRRDYAISVERYYATTVETMDFEKNLETSRQAINSWVQERTRQKIKEAVPYYGLTRDTSILPVSAAYFRASWAYPFNAASSRKLPFLVTLWDRRSVEMMELDGKALGYYNSQELACQVLEIPYHGNKVSMVILVPHDIEGMVHMEEALSHHLATVLGRIGRQWINIKIPKFTLEMEIPMKQYLQLTGVDDIFDYNMADLTMLGSVSSSSQTSGRLYAKELVHKTYFSIDEYGSGEGMTPASLATSVNGGGLDNYAQNPPPIHLTVDRPFMFLVLEKTTGNIFFMGRYVQPSYKAEYLGWYGANGSSRVGSGHKIIHTLMGFLVCIAIWAFNRSGC